MKKTFFLSLALFAFISTETFAQSLQKPNAPDNGTSQRQNRQDKPMADAATRTQRYTDRLTQTLSLDAATSKKVYDSYLARTNKVDEIQASTASGKDKNDALKANKDAFENSLKRILSADQFAQYSKMESDRKNHQGQGHRGEDGKPNK